MSHDKRVQEASTLRTFFDEQVQHLHVLWAGLLPLHAAPAYDEDRQRLENLVDAANSKLRVVHGYADKLREHVRALHGQVLQIHGQIPPPREVSRTTFGSDPLINALFVNTHDIERLFTAGAAMDAYWRSHDNDPVSVLHALLTAIRSERSVLGIGMLGDLLVRDVPQQTVNFSGHKLQLPCTSAAELSSALKQYLFGRIVAMITREMASRTAAETLNAGDKSYQARLNSLANPEVYLNALLGYLAPTTDFLRLERSHFNLNKLGVKLGEHDGQCANEFDIDELIWRDGSRQVVLQVVYPRS